jgi:hypothetical protein
MHVTLVASTGEWLMSHEVPSCNMNCVTGCCFFGCGMCWVTGDECYPRMLCSKVLQPLKKLSIVCAAPPCY